MKLRCCKNVWVQLAFFVIATRMIVEAWVVQELHIGRVPRYQLYQFRIPATTMMRSTTTTVSVSPAISSAASASSNESFEDDNKLLSSTDELHTDDNDNDAVPKIVTSPVLRQVYPHLIEYQKLHGHVNIPLGSSAGRQCQTLRRMQLQQKLTDGEVELLTQLQFRFTTLDDIYFQVPFDEMFVKLVEYEQQHPGTGYQIPKKYPPDPELGAWVTGIRRLAPTSHLTDDDINEETDSTTSTTKRMIDPHHVERLNSIGFTWKSERKCGSKFMQFYRGLLKRIEDEIEDSKKQESIVNGVDETAAIRFRVLQDPTIQTWIAAQRDTYQRGTMSETRQHYMTTLVGDESWKKKKPQEVEKGN